MISEPGLRGLRDSADFKRYGAHFQKTFDTCTRSEISPLDRSSRRSNRKMFRMERSSQKISTSSSKGMERHCLLNAIMSGTSITPRNDPHYFHFKRKEENPCLDHETSRYYLRNEHEEHSGIGMEERRCSLDVKKQTDRNHRSRKSVTLFSGRKMSINSKPDTNAAEWAEIIMAAISPTLPRCIPCGFINILIIFIRVISSVRLFV